MTKADDSSLDPERLRAVEGRAKNLLDRADAWSRFPTPVNDLIGAANLKVATHGIFDPAVIMAYIQTKAEQAAQAALTVKSAVAKLFGIYDGADNVIHVDETLGVSKQNFVKLHETGHHELPLHRKLFRIFQDCEKNLSPEIADQFEREANNFARFALFQGNGFSTMAADYAHEIKTPMRLARKFGASVYAACREYARSHHRACAVFVLEPIEYQVGVGAIAKVRRIECSQLFLRQFGMPLDNVISLNHELGKILPIGRKMTRPRNVVLHDLNGEPHECVAEAFDTTRNVILLIFPVRALTASSIVMSAPVITSA